MTQITRVKALISQFSLYKLYILILLVSCSFIIRAQESDKQVWVFYLSFWAGPGTWEWSAPVLDDYPLLGLYNSKMPNVAAHQIFEAKSAGIDAFIVSWFGIDEQVTTTPALTNFLDRAVEQDFKIGVAVDIFVDQFHRDRESIVRSLRWLMDEGITHSSYLHYKGKPIIFFAFQEAVGFDSETWLSIRDEVDPNRETWWFAEGLSACCLHGGAMDGMYAFNMAWANGDPNFYINQQNSLLQRDALYIPTLSPGWDEDKIARETNRPNPTSPRERNGGQFLIDSWNGALTVADDVLLIVSWNEFVENSHIEPSLNLQSQSLDVLRDLILEWKGLTALPAPDAPPTRYIIQVSEMAHLYEHPTTNAAILGCAFPGEDYNIFHEDSGMYGLEYNGEIGYVLPEYVIITPEDG